ncbi:CinA family protein [Pseudomonas sp. F1_0610]|uniref:CinA family protein n=1 Tax=Pseudomonas sp. F1_0610 TaxID=3114284 RepID=UPI0039C49BF1
MDKLSLLAERLGQALVAKKAVIATAESCTGGGIGEAITRVSGSSAWFEAGFITYSNKQKIAMLGVAEKLFSQVGAVSQAVVEAMALGALKKSKADYAIAVSGVAGPTGGTEDKPVGTVWLAWACSEKNVSLKMHYSGDRQSIRAQTIETALAGVLALLNEQSVENWKIFSETIA